MPSADQIRTAVELYVKFVGAGATEDIVNLYAEDATVEDPIGTEPRHGHQAIREFYQILEPLEKETELLTTRIGGNVAAFWFRLSTKAGEQTMNLAPIDIMEFNEDGKITSMKAVWSAEDMELV
ncbi:nuclear transport factor 2 family protein [Aldersonia kunmingensis]|uniref:nuclear transport factor 2 family protein n=1 Tax=Aldersonia kunmingensis TaxID=408066 RepID=UPI000831E220|nr:nuclear transport factor 2 family protein [Aldersonia kunmingensis]